MKLNPEQKTVYEYGKAVKDLSNIIKEIRNKARMHCGVEYHELPLQYRVELLNYFGFETFVGEVRYRRAACRTWMDVYKRNCENCKYFSRGKTEEPCVECSELYDAGIPEYWEPKKEEKNETDA